MEQNRIDVFSLNPPLVLCCFSARLYFLFTGHYKHLKQPSSSTWLRLFGGVRTDLF